MAQITHVTEYCGALGRDDLEHVVTPEKNSDSSDVVFEVRNNIRRLSTEPRAPPTPPSDASGVTRCRDIHVLS